MSAVHSVLIASFTLIAGPAGLPALTPAPQRQVLSLIHDVGRQVVHARSGVDAGVLLVAGPLAARAIVIGGIEVVIRPDFVLPLGLMLAGEVLSMPVPAEIGGIGLQLVGIELVSLELRASDAVFLPDRDLVVQSFAARIGMTPEGVRGVLVSLTAPTSGYELRLDGIDRVGDVTNAYFRLVEPGPDEITMTVLELHEASAALPGDPGTRVDVHLMRETRGGIGLPYYRLLASLLVAGSGHEVR